MDALFSPLLFPDTAATQSTIAAAKRWQSKLITTSGTFTVPSDVGVIWVDAVSGGGGGGGGNSTPGGGGGGGGAAMGVMMAPFAVTPNESITIAIGAAGTGGAANANGTSGGTTSLTIGGVLFDFVVGFPGYAGAAVNGGNGSNQPSGGSGVAGGAGVGASGVSYGPGNTSVFWGGRDTYNFRLSAGAAGGAVSFAGGRNTDYQRARYAQASTGSAAGGGGGRGGCGEFGIGGVGGASGAAITDPATGYGVGGGGGSGNNPGGNGMPGMVRIYCFSATTI